MPLFGCPKFVVFCMRCVFGCITFVWSLYLDAAAAAAAAPPTPTPLPPLPLPCDPVGTLECCCWFGFDDDWFGDCCCDWDCDCDGWSSVDNDGSYLRGRPRDKWRRFTNSLSSTIQNEPKSSSYLTKHLCSDKFVRIAFYWVDSIQLIFVCLFVCFFDKNFWFCFFKKKILELFATAIRLILWIQKKFQLATLRMIWKHITYWLRTINSINHLLNKVDSYSTDYSIVYMRIKRREIERKRIKMNHLW